MLTLANTTLKVHLLHPIEDQERLGTRYCHGGYVWQVEDAVVGPLLSGPDFPEEPDRFNGQGLPEVFTGAWGEDGAVAGGVVALTGIGEVEFTTGEIPFDPADNPHVITPCTWKVAMKPESATFTTHQALGDLGCRLVRSVTLADRCLKIGSHLTNTGRGAIPLRWFAHPFFPLTRDGRAVRFGPGIVLPAHPAYAQDADGTLRLQPDQTARSRYLELQLDRGTQLEAMQAHDRIDGIAVTGDFPLATLPLWYNGSTFSFEPYFETLLPPGQHAAWSLSYRFGLSKPV